MRATLPQRLRELTGADDAAVLQTIFCWLREGEQTALLADPAATEPVRRLFEPRWSLNGRASISRLERLTARAVEINMRLILADDYLFKVDIGSMRESLEVRVPLLDEELVEFGMTLPNALRTRGRTAKIVLRRVAAKRLPTAVAEKPSRLHRARRSLGRRRLQAPPPGTAHRPGEPGRRVLPAGGLPPVGRRVLRGAAGRGDLARRPLSAADHAARPRPCACPPLAEPGPALRVLVVTNAYPSASNVALGTFVKDQVDSVRALGIDVEVLYIDRAGQGSKAYRGLEPVLRSAVDVLGNAAGPVSRAELAERAGLSRRAAALVVGVLDAGDLLGEGTRRPRAG